MKNFIANKYLEIQQFKVQKDVPDCFSNKKLFNFKVYNNKYDISYNLYYIDLLYFRFIKKKKDIFSNYKNFEMKYSKSIEYN